MKPPTVSVVLTINERTDDVLRPVFAALKREPASDFVIVLDRAPQHVADFVKPAFPLPTIDVDGPPGWLCPARAWNAGFAHVASELTFVISSEVILEPGAIDRCRKLLGAAPAVLFGKCVESDPGKYAYSTASGVLCSAAQARPLGFIACIPTWALRATGGYDEAFMAGYWYDDDDFFYRLWKLGLPFLFDDQVAGVHQSHPRPVLDTPEGKAGIAANRAHILKKHGSEHPMNGQRILGRKSAGRTLWAKDAAFITQHALRSWGFEQ